MNKKQILKGIGFSEKFISFLDNSDTDLNCSINEYSRYLDFSNEEVDTNTIFIKESEVPISYETFM